MYYHRPLQNVDEYTPTFHYDFRTSYHAQSRVIMAHAQTWLLKICLNHHENIRWIYLQISFIYQISDIATVYIISLSLIIRSLKSKICRNFEFMEDLMTVLCIPDGKHRKIYTLQSPAN